MAGSIASFRTDLNFRLQADYGTRGPLNACLNVIYLAF